MRQYAKQIKKLQRFKVTNETIYRTDEEATTMMTNEMGNNDNNDKGVATRGGYE
jgi:hypothetical protein